MRSGARGTRGASARSKNGTKPCQKASGYEKGDLETQLAFIRENDLGGMNDMLVDHVTRAYETEEYDHAWRVTLDPDGNVYEMAYDRAGARISEQSEGAAAVVVGL